MYGFNLGQIEGLDSSVKTVTLTIANATESNTYTLDRYEVGDNVSYEGGSYSLERVPQVEEVFNSNVTDSGEVGGVNINFPSTIDDSDYKQWKVYVNGLQLNPDPVNQEFSRSDPDRRYLIIKRNDAWYLQVGTAEGVPVPGTYNVAISVPNGNTFYALYNYGFDENNVGEQYNVSLFIEEIDPSFKDAVEMVVGESGGSNATLTLYISYDDVLQPEQGKRLQAYADADLSEYSSEDLKNYSAIVIASVYNGEIVKKYQAVSYDSIAGLIIVDFDGTSTIYNNFSILHGGGGGGDIS